MEYLFISGAENVGKTENIYLITWYLVLLQGFRIIMVAPWSPFPPIPPPPFPWRNQNGKVPDFTILLEKLERDDKCGRRIRIVVNSPSDDRTIDSARRLRDFMDANPPVDILISAVRDNIGTFRNNFFRGLGISSKDIVEVPLAKITREQRNKYFAMRWYQRTIHKLLRHVLTLPPFNI